MRKSLFILLLVGGLIFIGFQNCGGISVMPVDLASLSCVPTNLRIETDNTSSSVVRFSITDFENLTTIAGQNFNWTFSENRTELYTAEAPELVVEKASLVACHTYHVTATYEDCGEPVTLNVYYTADGERCDPPVEDPPVDPPVYPPADPAPPGQQGAGAGCMAVPGPKPLNPNFDYSRAKYCYADTDINTATASEMAQYHTCINSGFDVSGARYYYPILLPNQYAAIEVTLPRPAKENLTLCGIFVESLGGSMGCGGIPGGALEASISPNPGDFSGQSGICHVGNINAGRISGAKTNSVIAVNRCQMDPARKYYLNMKAPGCTNASGCSFYVLFQGLYSDRSDCSRMVTP